MPVMVQIPHELRMPMVTCAAHNGPHEMRNDCAAAHMQPGPGVPTF